MTLKMGASMFLTRVLKCLLSESALRSMQYTFLDTRWPRLASALRLSRRMASHCCVR